MSGLKVTLGAMIVSLMAWTLPASSQETTFGKNKVQYTDFSWYYIQSSHFDVYFTEGGDYIADFTADVAESSYTLISKSFRYQITKECFSLVDFPQSVFGNWEAVREP